MPGNEFPIDLDADLALIADAAREGGDLAADLRRGNPRQWQKSDQSPVSEADIAVDRLLHERLTAARPHYGWLSEESEDDPRRLETSTLFVVDPIDGTRAFLEGGDQWVVSIAIVHHGKPRCGVLYSPLRDEFYDCAEGGGARRNGRAITVAKARPDRYRVAASKRAVDGLNLTAPEVTLDRRYVPSLAYRFALVSSGQFDATITSGHCRDWDVAAAALLAAEAGCQVRRLDGEAIRLNARETRQPPLIAGSPEAVDFLTRQTRND